MLWTLTAADEQSLDRYEGVAGGAYRKDYVDVTMPGGKHRRALIYIAADSKPGKPRPGYMERILSGAKECRLPRAYIAQLKPWLR